MIKRLLNSCHHYWLTWICRGNDQLRWRGENAIPRSWSGGGLWARKMRSTQTRDVQQSWEKNVVFFLGEKKYSHLSSRWIIIVCRLVRQCTGSLVSSISKRVQLHRDTRYLSVIDEHSAKECSHHIQLAMSSPVDRTITASTTGFRLVQSFTSRSDEALSSYQSQSDVMLLAQRAGKWESMNTPFEAFLLCSAVTTDIRWSSVWQTLMRKRQSFKVSINFVIILSLRSLLFYMSELSVSRNKHLRHQQKVMKVNWKDEEICFDSEEG